MDYPRVQYDIHLQSGSIFHCYVSLPECIYVKPYTYISNKNTWKLPKCTGINIKNNTIYTNNSIEGKWKSFGKQKHWAHWLAPEPFEPSTDANHPNQGWDVGQQKQSLNRRFKINKLLHTHIFTKYTATKNNSCEWNLSYTFFLGGDVLCFLCLSGQVLTLRMETQHTWKSPRSSPIHLYTIATKKEQTFWTHSASSYNLKKHIKPKNNKSQKPLLPASSLSYPP